MTRRPSLSPDPILDQQQALADEYLAHAGTQDGGLGLRQIAQRFASLGRERYLNDPNPNSMRRSQALQNEIQAMGDVGGMRAMSAVPAIMEMATGKRQVWRAGASPKGSNQLRGTKPSLMGIRSIAEDPTSSFNDNYYFPKKVR